MESISFLFDEQVGFPKQCLFQEALAAKQAELVKALFECMPAFSLSHTCIVTDLTPIVTIDRHVRLPLSQGRGHGVGFCSRLMELLNFQGNIFLEEAI